MPPQDSSEHEKEKIERLRRAMYSRSLSEKIKDRPRRDLSMDAPVVGDDFRRPEPGVPGRILAPRTIGYARSALWWLLGIAVVFFIGAAAFFAYYFVLGGGSLAAPPGNISISVAGPPQIHSGEPTELQVVVANRNNMGLQLADLVITYPDGTRSPTDFATPLPSQRISLGQIEPGGTRQGTVSAVFAGNEGKQAKVKVELEYRIDRSSAIFVASTEYALTYSSSPLSISVDSNNETISGQPVEFNVTVSSNSVAPVSDVLFTAQYPFGFKFSSATPAPSEPGLWLLGTLNPSEKKVITIRGTVTGGQGDARVFQFAAGTRQNATSKKIETQLAGNTFTVNISKPFLDIGIAINGSSNKNVVVSPGENVAVVISWQNNLTTAITNAVVAARLSGVQIDGSKVNVPNGFYRSSDSVVLWDKTTSSGALSNLAPGARGSLTFNFQMPTAEELGGIINPELSISVNAAGNRVSETGVPENLQATADRKITLASNLQLAAQGLYYSSPFGGTGPMPPKAGSETTYAIVFTVTNSSSQIKNAKVTATLPAYVRWTGSWSPPNEEITFNQLNNTVTWDVGTVEPGVGLNGSNPKQAAFSIGFTPSTSQIGQEPILLQDIQLTGIDTATNAAVTKAAKNVTTNILGDPGFNASNATVVK